MARKSETAAGVAYPQLDRAQLDVIIADLFFAARNRMPGPDTAARDAVAGYLTGFYTRRWGLPAVLRSAAAALDTSAGPRGSDH